MNIKKLYTLSIGLTLCLVGCCDLTPEPFEIDPEVEEKLNILSLEKRIEIDGVMYKEVSDIFTDKIGEHCYSLGPTGKVLYGRETYIDFYKINNDLGFNVLTTSRNDGVLYVDSTQIENFSTTVTNACTKWESHLTNSEHPYDETILKFSETVSSTIESNFEHINELKDYAMSSEHPEYNSFEKILDNYETYRVKACTPDGAFYVSNKNFTVVRYMEERSYKQNLVIKQEFIEGKMHFICLDNETSTDDLIDEIVDLTRNWK